MTSDQARGARVVREFLYVDSTKVNGLLGQLDNGVPEASTASSSSTAITGAGARQYAWREQNEKNDSDIERSLADSNFPLLEEILEAEGLLTDLSSILKEEENWSSQYWRDQCPPGSIVRLTLPATLFDSRYVAEVMKSWASTIAGLQLINVYEGSPSSAKTPPKFPRHPEIPPELDEYIPAVGPFSEANGTSKLTREYLQGIVKIARGLFSPGLHLVMQPYDGGDNVAVARLEENRRFLDATSDILFARYGVHPQDWTMVGTIGHYPGLPTEAAPSGNLASSSNSFSRIRTAKFINETMRFVGNLGFADLPAFPSFAVVPLAVYRTQQFPQPGDGVDVLIQG